MGHRSVEEYSESDGDSDRPLHAKGRPRAPQKNEQRDRPLALVDACGDATGTDTGELAFLPEAGGEFGKAEAHDLSRRKARRDQGYIAPSTLAKIIMQPSSASL